MPAGRPRTVSFSEEEMTALGEEMLEWVRKNNPIHLSMWYSIEKMFTEKQWDTFQQRAEFVPYYEMALKLVGYNYLTKGSDVEPAIKQRWQRVYFKDLRREENESLEYEAKLKAQETQQVSEQHEAQHKALLQQLDNLQSSLNKANTNNCSDIKS